MRVPEPVERPVDRLARQVRDLVRAEKRGRNLEAEVAAAVGEIIDSTMRRVAREHRGTWGAGRGEAMEPWSSPLSLGAAYEELLMLRPRMVAGELEFKPPEDGGHARRRRGAYYTPEWLVGLVLEAALEPVMEGMSEKELMRLRVLDPACGSGHFLVAAAERIARRLAKVRGARSVGERESRDAGACVFGMDSDPVAVALCRAAIWREGSDVDARVVVADGLLDDPPGGGESFDAVVGNPPFLNRLERRTATSGAAWERLKKRFGEAARAYTDVSALFLLRAVELTRAGGRAALVQPQSILTSRDAAGVRREIMKRGVISDIWLADEHHFDASVFVCVPTVLVGHNQQGPVLRRRGERQLSTATIAVAGAEADSWGALGATDGPTIDGAKLEGTIGDVAEVSADFRDEYYGLRGMVVEDSAGREREGFPALVTTGLVDPACCLWGSAPCRFDGQRWESPRVDLGRLKRETELGKWAKARLRPKVLLATQTRVLEAAVDEGGEWLPVTPLISIVPKSEKDLWWIGAALSSPVLTVLAMQRSAGAALTRDAIKLSATQVRALPLPPRNSDSRRAAGLFKKACRATKDDRRRLLHECAAASCLGFGLGQDKARVLAEWWLERLGGPRP